MSITQSRVAALSLIAAMSVVACGDDGDTQSGSSIANVEQAADRIYELTSHTRNETSCDDDGESVIDMTEERYFAPEVESFFGFPVATVASCMSPDQCRERRAEDNDDFPEWSVLVEEDSWISSRIPPFSDTPGDACSVLLQASTMVVDDGGGMVRIETRQYLIDGLFVDKEGFCNTDQLDSGNFDQYPCQSIEVYVGTYVEDL